MAPKKSSMIIGRQPLVEALQSGKAIDKILLQKNATGDVLHSIRSLAREHHIPIQLVPVEKLNGLTRANHQGVIAFAALVQYLDLQQVIDHVVSAGTTPLFLMLDGVTDMSWTDGRERAVGHDQQLGKRNTPSLSNSWASSKLFWDGRASTLEDQAYGPVNNDIEMHGSMPEVPAVLRKITGYKKLFANAYGTEEMNVDRVVHAIATYERTLVSRKSDFDYFLQGDATKLSDAALRGMHLFRTKARCMNCHNGPLFTDQQFHNVGLTYYGREFEDLGLYKVTGKAAHVGQFKTPSLRDVMRTRPWMHNGLFDDMEGILNMYNAGMPQPKPKQEQLKDTLYPRTDPLLKKLNLTKAEKQDIIAFMNAITAQPWKVRMPDLPK